MDTEGDLDICHTFPIIYKVNIKHKCFDEILNLFVNEILQEVSYSEVESTIMSYVTRVIEPVGWKAVWRATQESLSAETECDFVVEVIDVSLVKLEADVIVQQILCPDVNVCDLESIQAKFRTTRIYTVPLIELYPISENDDAETFAKTAITIGHVRFFYKHLLRPWDMDDDISYTEKTLQPRLQLYFDINNKVLPEVMVSKIRTNLKEAWSVMASLKSLYSSMNISDSELELSEDDVIDTIDLRRRLEELQRNMDILENPVIRTIIMKKFSPRKSPQKQAHDGGPLTYLIAPQFTYQMIADLKLDLTTILKFDYCPEHALKTCADGDTVYIFPGHYRCDTLGWLDSDITVKGFGPLGSVRIEATGNSEVFLNCDSPFVTLENLTMIVASGTVSSVVVHHGSVTMKDCLVDSDRADSGITLLAGSELTMENSEVCNAKEDGIQLRPSSILTMKNSKIVSCGRHGIQIDADEDINLAAQPPITELFILDSYIISNDGYGIFINSSPANPSSHNGGINHTLDLFPWLKHSVENTVMSHNRHMGVGTAPKYKLLKNPDMSGISYFTTCGDSIFETPKAI